MLQPPALEKFFKFPLHIARQFLSLLCHKRSECRVILVNDLIEKGLLGSVALVTTSIPIPAGRPGRHMRHVPRPCNTVFTYSLSLSGKFFYPQPKCLPLLDIASQYPSLPLNRRRWLAGDIVGHPGDTTYFVDDPVGYQFQEVVGQMRPARGHEVDGFHCTQGNDPFVAAGIADHTDRLDRQEYGEGLAGLVVQVSLAQLLDEDVVGAAQDIGVLLAHFGEDAYT